MMAIEIKYDVGKKVMTPAGEGIVTVIYVRRALNRSCFEPPEMKIEYAVCAGGRPRIFAEHELSEL